ncbi:MAG: hypothetical protein HY690_02500 [Chloroflexi bacterium]|nr:hypothetical protein [Chloroflexota bacterium]
MISVERRAAIAVAPFATALAVVGAACYALGAFLVLVAPGPLLALYGAWLFLDASALVPGRLFVTLPQFIIGLVTVAIGAWLFGAVWALLYNAWSGAREARA